MVLCHILPDEVGFHIGVLEEAKVVLPATEDGIEDGKNEAEGVKLLPLEPMEIGALERSEEEEMGRALVEGLV